jgi:ABC-type antimicrobial peptide transport system permease subunit
MVAGLEARPVSSTYEVVGIAADRTGRERGWSRDIFLPFRGLPPALRADGGRNVLLHVELTDSKNVTGARDRLEKNLKAAVPNSLVQIRTGQDENRATHTRFQLAYLRGFGFSGILLLFAVANVSLLTIHWVTRRQREFAVRLALGSTVSGIVGMILFEQVLIGVAGGVLSIPIVLLGLLNGNLIGIPSQPSWGVIPFTAITAIFAGVLSSVLPLARLLRVPLRDSLRLED